MMGPLPMSPISSRKYQVFDRLPTLRSRRRLRGFGVFRGRPCGAEERNCARTALRPRSRTRVEDARLFRLRARGEQRFSALPFLRNGSLPRSLTEIEFAAYLSANCS